jgi:hypothetical protein
MPASFARRLLPCLLLAAVSAAAQTQSVSFFGNVVDKKGNAVAQAAAADLPSLVIAKAPAANLKVSPAAETPLFLGVLMDMSNSDGATSFLAQSGNAALHLMNQVVRRGKDAAFLGGFSLKIDYDSGLTDDRQQWLKTAQQMKVGGPTALYDAIAQVCTKELRPEAGRGSVRRVLIIVSDGGDNQSKTNQDAALAAALENGVTIFVVDPRQEMGDPEWARLKKFADDTGGRGINLAEADQVAPAFATIQQDINAQQWITAEIPAAGGGHLLEVRSQGKGTLRWRLPKKVMPASSPAPSN